MTNDSSKKLTQEMVWQFIEMGDPEFEIEAFRIRYQISAESSAFYMAISRLLSEKKLKRLGRGRYRRVAQVKPIKVFGRERKLPKEITFPRDFNTMDEILPAYDIIIREGDLILISGRSNYGKTALCMNFCGENIESHPVLMGNEYTTIDHEPAPRFMNRLDNMDWINWANGDGEDKFVLLPVYADYAEHIMRDRINIVDWLNIDTGEFYLISHVMEEIKRQLGKGIGIIAIQKAEGAMSGRGGQFTKDFADVEILLDEYGEREIMLTMGKVKESTKKVSGRKFAFSIENGVKIVDFRELQKCASCYGKGWKGMERCDDCGGTGFVNKPNEVY